MNEGLKIVIFGAGEAGRDAFEFVGKDNVHCFVDNKCSSDHYLGKRVISVENLKDIYQQTLVIIASYNCSGEIENQLDNMGMIFHITFTRDFPWKDRLLFPYFVKGEWNSFSYRQLIGYFKLDAYKSLSIYTSLDRLMLLMLMLVLSRMQDRVKHIVIGGEHKVDKNDVMPHAILSKLTTLDVAYKKTESIVVDLPREEDMEYIFLDSADQKKVIYLSDYEQFVPVFRHPELKKFKDIHKGERCFVVGNGPSLSVEDLEKIHTSNEISFAANKIYKIFDKTNWRPTYYGVSDADIYGTAIKEIRKLKLQNIFLSDTSLHNWYLDGTDIAVDDAYYFHVNFEKYGNGQPRFTNDPSRMFYYGCTVTFDFSLQMALYMGFENIYLIGCDNGTRYTDYKRFQEQGHFYEERLSPEAQDFYDNHKFQNLDRIFENTEKAYLSAKQNAEKRGINIYNATRGGCLEVFSRVDFDELF